MKFSVMILIEAESKEEAIVNRCNGEVHSVAEVKMFSGPKFETKSEPWPVLLLPLKAIAKEGDTGAGDIIARTIGPIGGEAFKVWYKKIFGKDCGCGGRQDYLNKRWPL